MKRKMMNIMTTMLLISNISLNTVYASPVLEPAPAPDMSITTEAENNNETTEETNGHNTSDMPDSNDGFHDGSEGINDDGNEGYGLLEEVGGGVEETSSYINLGILKLDSFLVKNMDGDYALKDYYAKIDEIIDYAKKKTKIKYFNSNSDENISNSLNKTLRGIEYDEEKNIFYMDLEKSDRDYDSTYSKKNRTNDEKLYRVYFKLNYVYDGKRTDDVDFNYIINDIKSKNEDEIDDIKLVDDEFYGKSGYNYLNVEITDKNGNKYKSKIIIETDQNQNQDYDQSGNINYDKPILTEEEIKNGQISNEHYNEIRDFIKSKDIFKPKNNFYIRNSVLNLDNNYKYYISLTDGQYSKNFYLKTVENEENNIDLNNLVVDDEVHYLQDINSIINDPIFGYDTLRVKTIIDNGQKYNLISAENNLLTLSSFIYRKYPNEKIVNVDKKEKDNDIYLIFNLTNNKQYVLKLNKIIIPNIKLDIDNNYLSSQNQDDIKKTIKYFYKNQIENFQNFTLFKENGQTKVKFEYSNYQSDNFDKYLIVNVNNPDNETVELFDPSTIQDKQEHLYNINIKYNPNIDEINEEGFYDAGTVEIDKNLDARIYKEYKGAGPSIGGDTDIQIIESLKQKLNITNKIIPKNWKDGYLKYDKDKQKFYQEYSILSTDDEDSNKNEKIYRFYFIGTNKDYEFSDENDTKLDLTDEKNINIILTFIKQEYDNVKDIKLNNKNILTENNKNYLDVKITEDDGTERDAKIFLNPTTMNSNIYHYKNININVTVSTKELSNRKLKQKTIDEINATLNKKINNNILYKDEYFIANDYNIYENKYSPVQSYYINIYDLKNKINKQINVSVENDLTADLLLENNDNTYELDINNFKVSEYKQCNKYNKNNIYLSKNGEIPILDYINSKLDNNSYADNLRLYKTSSYYKIMADVIDKNTHEKKTIFIIHCNRLDSENKKLFFINNINDDLKLTEKNKKDLEKLIKNTENVNIKNIEFEEKFNKETLIFKDKTVNYYEVKATIYFENNYSEIKTYNIVIDSNYQDQDTVDILNNYLKPGLPFPTCPSSQPKYLGPPAYGGKTRSKDKKEVNIKIKIPSADDFPDITPCDPNKPNKPNEDVPNPPTPNEIVPKEPNEDAPHTPTPSNLPKISSPSPKTSNPPTVTERTPITEIVEQKVSENIENKDNTGGLPEIKGENRISRDIKTGDNLFKIIIIISGFFGLFYSFYISFNKKQRKLN